MTDKFLSESQLPAIKANQKNGITNQHKKKWIFYRFQNKYFAAYSAKAFTYFKGLRHK